MVGFDDLASDIERFDAVRIDCTLGKPLGIGDLLSLGIEDLNKVAADDFALLLRVSNALEIREEALTSVYADDIEAQALVVTHDIVELVFTEHTMVDKDTGETVANSTIEIGRASCRERV